MALLVSLHTTLTILCDIKKLPNAVLFCLTLTVFHLTTCRILSVTHADHYESPPTLSHLLHDRSRLLNSLFPASIQRTASTTTIRWSVQRTMMNNPRSYSSSMTKLTRHNHRQTILLTQYHHNHPPVLQPRSPHHQLPPTLRQTNRFGPKYTPCNLHML